MAMSINNSGGTITVLYCLPARVNGSLITPIWLPSGFTSSTCRTFSFPSRLKSSSQRNVSLTLSCVCYKIIFPSNVSLTRLVCLPNVVVSMPQVGKVESKRPSRRNASLSSCQMLFLLPITCHKSLPLLPRRRYVSTSG